MSKHITAWEHLSDSDFIQLAKQYKSRTEFARSLGYANCTPKFRNRLDALEIKYDRYSTVSKEVFQEAVNNADSIGEVIENLGLNKSIGGYYSMVRKWAHRYEIELPKFTYKAPNVRRNNSIPDNEYFRKNTDRSGPSTRRRLIKIGWEYKCSTEICPLSNPGEIIAKDKLEWVGGLITLHVDHIDGDHFNNELENLRFLCPNCHAATDTYAGKNIKYRPPTPERPKNFCKCGKEIFRTSTSCQECESKNRVGILNHDYPPLEVMISQVEDKGYYAYGKELGTSDNAIRKHLRRNGVNPLPKKLPKSNFCVDCPKSVHRTSIRCPDCARKHRYSDFALVYPLASNQWKG